MKCDCCGTTEDFAGVACSALGPISFGYCGTCAVSGAEPKWLIEATIEDLGGMDKVRAELLDGVTYLENGKYIKMRNFGQILPRGK